MPAAVSPGSRVGIKKPAQKNPPKKKRLKNPKKTHPQVGFLGFFERSLCFVNKFPVFPFKRPLNHK
jgi:hypothetical protein